MRREQARRLGLCPGPRLWRCLGLALLLAQLEMVLPATAQIAPSVGVKAPARMPPMMMMGVASGSAPRRKVRNISDSRNFASAP